MSNDPGADAAYAQAMNDLMAKKFKENGGCFGKGASLLNLVLIFLFFMSRG